MQIRLDTTKNAPAYRVFLDGEEVKNWIAADDIAGTVTREVADTSGGMRFMRRAVVRGVVVIRAPKAPKQAATP